MSVYSQEGPDGGLTTSRNDQTMPTVKLPCRVIRDQGRTVNCCTSCALSACLEAARPDLPELSPMFHYRQSGGRSGSRGLTEEAALAGAGSHGFCLQSLHPVEISDHGLSTPVSQEAIDDGRTRRLRDRSGRPLWRPAGSPDRVSSWRSALDRGHPVFLTIATDHAYWNLGSSNLSTWEPTTEAPGTAGDHAVAILGYDDARGHFIVQDSRGTSFGAGGQWFLPYAAAQRSNRITASYAIDR